MATEVRAPLFPESVSEGTIMTWHKQVGDPVRVDEKLADIETDKIVLEVMAQSAGVVEKIAKAEGETVTSGEVIGLLGDADVAPASDEQSGSQAEQPKKAEPKAKEPATQKPERSPSDAAQPSTSVAPADQTDSGQASSESAEVQEEPAASPSARKLMVEHKIDPTQVQGSGRGGLIGKGDVLAYLDAQRKEKEQAASAPPASSSAPAVPATAPRAAPAPAQPASDEDRLEERVPMTRIRARIAERLVQAQQTSAILTTFNEVNMKPVMDLRARYRNDFEEKHGVKLGFMSFFVKAVTEALKRYPVVNAFIDGSDIVYHGYYDIGIAVSSPRGLVVPVLRNADHLSFAEIESRVRDFGTRAQANQLGLDELAGGTFSISNGGVFGSMLSTPILNPPQSAILGMHNITERPIAEEGQVVIRPVMYLALSYDHRIIDGREAILFLVTIKQMLEDPTRLLLEV